LAKAKENNSVGGEDHMACMHSFYFVFFFGSIDNCWTGHLIQLIAVDAAGEAHTDWKEDGGQEKKS
jgi:hypothetical protein